MKKNKKLELRKETITILDKLQTGKVIGGEAAIKTISLGPMMCCIAPLTEPECKPSWNMVSICRC